MRSNDYSTVPTIGPLLLLHFVSAVFVAVGLIVPLRRLVGRDAHATRAVTHSAGSG
jgi:hypothetical protein